MGGTRIELGSKCPCCINLQIREGFQKVLELKDIGLIIYCQHLCMDDVNKAEDVVLIHNTKNMKISSIEVLQHIDQNRIPCPRCKQRIRHAQALLKKVPTIDKSDVMAVCEHCRLEALSEAPCTTCDKILKGFLSAFGKQKKDSKKTERITFFKDIPQGIPIHSRSEEDISILKSESPKSIGELIFDSEDNIQNPVAKHRKMKLDSKTTVLDKSELMFDSEDNIQKPVEKLRKMKSDSKATDLDKSKRIADTTQRQQTRTHQDDLNKVKMIAETRSAVKAAKMLKSEGKENTKGKLSRKKELIIGKKNIQVKPKQTKEEPHRAKKQQVELLKTDQSKSPIETNYVSKKKTKRTKDVFEYSKEKERLPKKLPTKDDKSTGLGLDDKKLPMIAGKKAKKSFEVDSKPSQQANDEVKSEPMKLAQKSKTGVKSRNKELEVTQVKLLKPSIDSLMLNLIKLTKTAPKKVDIAPAALEKKMNETIEKVFKDVAVGSSCDDSSPSDLEADIISNEDNLHHKADCKDIIIGEHLAKFQPPHVPLQVEGYGVKPMFFQSKYLDEAPFEPPEDNNVKKSPEEKDKVVPDRKGIMLYALSDRTFIEKGWTKLPTEKVMRKMNIYRMRPAHPEFDWFEHNKNKRVMEYDTGEIFALIDDNGRGRWYYKNGQIALDYYDAEETNAQQRFVVYSSGQPDEHGRCHPITVLASFDYLGNGIVFDHTGKIRLKYNQSEGVLLDRSIGPVSHWKWHTLNDPPVLEQVMIDTQMAHKDPTILKFQGTFNNSVPDNEDMLAIEYEKLIKEKSKKLSQKFKPFQIKMKALKINEHFSLRVLDQATVYLIFRDGSTNLKLNIGMVLDHQEIVETDVAELGQVSNNLERFPARTESLAKMQRTIAFAQRYERFHSERKRRLRPAEPCASADKLISAASRPLRRPLMTMAANPSGSTSNTEYSRKPSNNLCCNTRLM